MTRIEITGWRIGARKVEADKLLAHVVGLGLASGKALVDEVLSGKTVDFAVADEEEAAAIVVKLQELNFDARIKQ